MDSGANRSSIAPLFPLQFQRAAAQAHNARVERDRLELRLSTASPAAAAHYREGADLFLAGFPGAEAAIEQALRYDERFALAHVARARLAQAYGRAAEVRESLVRARQFARAATPRERSHVEIHGLVMEGAQAKALEALLRHVEEWPRDALVLSLALGAFGLFAFSGRADHDAARLALCERMAPEYGADWWFLGHLGWSLTEAGRLGPGLDQTERSLALRRHNANAAHAMAHWFAESREAGAGTLFLEGWLGGYARNGVLFAHLAWHLALWQLERGSAAGALKLLEEEMLPGKSLAPPINVVSDCASLLWRISMREGFRRQAIGWKALEDYIEERFPGPAPHFVEWHVCMSLAAGADRNAAQKRLKTVRDREAAGVLPTAGILAAACDGFAAYTEGRYKDAVELLERVRHQGARLGGSGAQRRIIDETLATAKAKLAPAAR